MSSIDHSEGGRRGRWSHRARPAILLAAATLASAGVAAAASAAAAGAAGQAPRSLPVRTLAPSNETAWFTAPASGALVSSGAVPVRIQAASGVSSVRVWVGADNVSSRFSKHGDAFTARLPRSLFTLGENRLLAQALSGSHAGAAARVSFVVGRPVSELMSVQSGQAQSALLGASPVGAGPLGVSGVSGVAGDVPVSVTSAGATNAVLTVNGHRVADIRAGEALRARSWLVSRSDGLRFGRNRFALEVWNQKGEYTVKQWNVERGRNLPLAEAGPRERVVRPHAWTTLNGGQSVASQPGAKLGYAWTIVSAPNGATGQLIDATGATPRFESTVPGVYQVALKVTQHDGSIAPASVGEDVTTLDVVPPDGPQGLYVDTGLFGQGSDQLAPPFNSLRVEGQTFTDSTHGNPDNWVQLDAATLAVVASGTHDQIIPTAGTITIGQWDGVDLSDVTWDPTVGGAEYGSQVWLGTTLVASNYSVNGTDFSKVGNPTTNLHGWIEPAKNDATADYSWFSSDMLQVETRLSTDTATTNTMDINGTKFQQTLPSGSPGGYQLVVLGNDGSVVDNELYALASNPNPATETVLDQQIELELATKTASYPSQTATILLQAFGTVPALDPDGPLASQIQSHGGRADVVDRFTGTANSTGAVYALIAGPSQGGNSWSPGWRAIEASDERTGAGSLNALMVRDSQDDAYVPYNQAAAGPATADSISNAFLPLAYAAPHSWADWIRPVDDANGPLSAPTAAQSAAYSDMLAEIENNKWLPTDPNNPSVTISLCPNAVDPLRGFYCDTSASDLLNLKTEIQGQQLQFDATRANGRYTETDWDTVQQSILDELSDVITIRSSIATYQSLYGTSSAAGEVNVTGIGDAVKAEITRLTTHAASANLGNLLSALSGVTAPIPEVGTAMSFLSGAYSLATIDEPDSSQSIDLGPITIAQDTAASALLNAMQNANNELSTLGDYVVSDPVKLEQASSYFLSTTPHQTNATSDFVRATEYATEQWLWGSILSTDYSWWSIPAPLGTNPGCIAYVNGKGDYQGQPWSNVSQQTGVWKSTAGMDDVDTDSNWMIGFDSGAAGDQAYTLFPNNPSGLSPTITNAVFGPIDPTSNPTATTGAGAIMPYFALDYFHIKSPTIVPEKYWNQGWAYGGYGCFPGQYAHH